MEQRTYYGIVSPLNGQPEIEAQIARISALTPMARSADGWSKAAPALRRSLFALEALLTLHLSAEEEALAGLTVNQRLTDL